METKHDFLSIATDQNGEEEKGWEPMDHTSVFKQRRVKICLVPRPQASLNLGTGT